MVYGGESVGPSRGRPQPVPGPADDGDFVPGSPPRAPRVVVPPGAPRRPQVARVGNDNDGGNDRNDAVYRELNFNF